MVNKYKRKTTNASRDEETMKLAMEESKKKKYGINLSTLQKQLKKGSAKKILGRFVPVFTEAQELELVNYIFHMDSLFYGLTKKEFLELVFQYTEKIKSNIHLKAKQLVKTGTWVLWYDILILHYASQNQHRLHVQGASTDLKLKDSLIFLNKKSVNTASMPLEFTTWTKPVSKLQAANRQEFYLGQEKTSRNYI
ncbi:unnamed protein product [Euphydryas editha]|uniref:Uncharacterized protein n=1 Tax=Euphydryas editha TaxID=104508 RepID=A0AAU9UWZ5_EUPED|nr:unnamed protein product [Euphydryas editha]